jgi:hypothetical protein
MSSLKQKLKLTQQKVQLDLLAEQEKIEINQTK